LSSATSVNESPREEMATGRPRTYKVLMVHNEYGQLSGEEIVVRSTSKMLEEHGHRVIPFIRSSAEISGMAFGKLRAFFSGIYSRSSRLQMRQTLEKEKPDVVHVHNVFPLISPSVLGECRRARIPVVMTVHNYRLMCPNGLHMTGGQICEKCLGGREYWCALKNCEKGLFKSIGYALRNYVARKGRFFVDNVTMYAALTDFQRTRLIAAGFPVERIVVIPNMASPPQVEQTSPLGDYVGFVGRVSAEKGLLTLLSAASACVEIPFKAAGGYDRMPELVNQAPTNFQFLGQLGAEKLGAFYDSTRMVVLCSTWFEGFPMVLVEAMLRGKPVICSRIGGLPEIVDHDKTGLLFEPGNAVDLAAKIRFLWDRPDLCTQMGKAGRAKALQEYGPVKYYERLIKLYDNAITLFPEVAGV
jgi:glycosyltransferase involved in cell wall biosynthesis